MHTFVLQVGLQLLGDVQRSIDERALKSLEADLSTLKRDVDALFGTPAGASSGPGEIH